MKKFLALMFVCAGLTAMAAAPHVNNTAKITKKATSTQVMKSAAKTMDRAQMQAQPATKVSTNSLTPRSFFKENNLTPNDNMLLTKKAPKRVDAGMYGENTHIAFRYVYTFNDSGYMVKDDPYYDGSSVYFTDNQNTLYCAGLYWNPMGSSYYLPLDMDYTNKTVSFDVGFILDDSTYTGNWKYYSAQNVPVSGGSAGYYRMDTTLHTYLVNENYFFNEEGDGFDEPITGVIYDDGSIQFNEENGYAYFGTMKVQTMYRKTNNASATVLSTDSTEFYNIFRGTQFIVPNATHEFQFKGSATTATTYTENIYAYQSEDTTVVAFGLYGFGVPAVKINVYEPVEGYHNLWIEPQVMYDAVGRDFMNSTFELDENYGFIFDDEGYVDGFEGIGTVGDATNEYLYWESTVLMDTAAGSLLYPFFNNYIRLNDGIFLIGYAQTPTITETPGDDAYTYAGTSDETGVEVHLFKLTLDEEGQIVDYEMVDNPYVVTRTDVDQVIALGAVADGENIGKNPSDVFIQEYTVPAKVSAPAYERGDVNMDGNIDINDVTRLIDVVLGKDVAFDETAADCNTAVGDGGIDINDVTALITRVLTGAWAN